MPFGIDTVTFVSFEETGTPDSLGNRKLAEVLTPAPWCRHRPLTFTETAELQFDVATEVWKTTIPTGEYDPTLRTKVLAAKSNDVIRVDDVDYQIIGGIRPFKDERGHFKATIMSKKQIG